MRERNLVGRGRGARFQNPLEESLFDGRIESFLVVWLGMSIALVW